MLIFLKWNWKKSLPKRLQLLEQIYRTDCLFCTQIYDRFIRFKDGRESIINDPKIGSPKTSTTNNSIKKMWAVEYWQSFCNARFYKRLPNFMYRVSYTVSSSRKHSRIRAALFVYFSLEKILFRKTIHPNWPVWPYITISVVRKF